MSGSRLMLARQLKGLTQTQLANTIGISQRAISKYEQTGEGVGSDALSSIAKILGFDPLFFEGDDVDVPTEGAISFRARSKMSAKKKNQAIASSGFGLILSDWMDREYVLPASCIPDYSGLDPEVAAEMLRAEWGLGEGPVADMIATLESNGVRVFSVAEASQLIDAFSFWDELRNRPFVFLTTSKSGERRRMDAAHELGHLVLHRKVDLKDGDSREVEHQADAFASAFLMPNRGFRSFFTHNISLDDVMHAKKIWKVSAFAVVYRAHSLGLITDWRYHDLCVVMSKRGMRTKEIDGIVPERSQIDDQVLSLTQEEYGTTKAVSDATKLPYALIMSLTFNLAPIKVIDGSNGNGTAASPKVSKTGLRIV